MEVLAHFALWVLFRLGDINTFYHILAQKSDKKFVKIHTDFQLYQVFMCNLLCQNSRKELKGFAPGIYGTIWDISTKICTQRLVITFCSKLF